MACPNQGVISETITFTIRTLNSSDVPTNADANPTYSIYEEMEIPTNIIVGHSNVNMTADANVVGLYSKGITLTTALFEIYKEYIVVIKSTVDGLITSQTYAFTVVNEEDVEDQALVTDMNAVSEFSGSFQQSGVVTLKLKITTFDGIPINPFNPTITISGPTQEGDQDPSTNGAQYPTIVSAVPYQADVGFYLFSWEVPSDQAQGSYVVDWAYAVDDIEKHEFQNINIATNEISPFFYTERWIAFRAALEHHINCAQSIPVYYEQAKPSHNQKVYKFSFKEWNQSAGVRVYRNGKLLNSGAEIDYFKGQVTFNTALLEQETVHLDYNFKWFSDEDLDRFILNAINALNAFAPHTGYTVDNIPDRLSPIVLYGASKDALRQIMMCLQFQQPAQVFGGRENADKAFANFETLKKNYEGDWNALTAQKALGPYPKTLVTSTPEFTLPGGRSRWFRYLFK